MKKPGSLFLFLLALHQAALAQPGTLDPAFGNAGIALTDVASSSDDALAVVLQPDGRVVLAGATSAGGAGSFFLARYLTNGDPDPSFGSFGKVTTQITTQGDGATDLLLRPDGRLVAVGFSNGGADGLTAVQYLADGSLDSTFADDGIASFPLTYTLKVKAALQSDGRVVCASGYEPTFDWIIIRLDTDGTLDSSYASNGSRILDAGLGQPEYLEDMITQSDDRAVLVGWSDFNFNDHHVALARLTTTGDLDNSFSIDGTSTINYHVGGGTSENMRGIVQLPDTRLLIAGDDVVNGSPVVRISRLFPDGSMDLAYGIGGSGLDSIPGAQVLGKALGLQVDGRAVIAGTTYDGTEQDIAVWRFNANGSVDGTFGSSGVVTTDIGSVDVTNAVVVGMDRIFVTGRTNPFTTFDVFVAAYASGLNVGIATIEGSGPMRLSPNPAWDHLRCSWDRAADWTGPFHILDPTGRVITTIPVPSLRSNEAVIDVSTLRSGIYYLAAGTGSEQPPQRFVVIH